MLDVWQLVQTLGFVLALEGALDFVSDRHLTSCFRQLITAILDRDPAIPRLPDNWEEWYNN
jgi:hypothetical protein